MCSIIQIVYFCSLFQEKVLSDFFSLEDCVRKTGRVFDLVKNSTK